GRAAPAAERVAPAALPPVFAELRGVFVTLRQHPGGRLRGCIGFPLPVHSLENAVREAAVSAGTEDPRFSPVRADELASLTVEVSVLTVPVPVRGHHPEEVLREVRAGRDGLIVDGYGTSGLLLPQVATEQGWSSEELLEGTCEKAGLPPHCWRDPKVKVRRFEAEVFAERAPGGDVAREAREGAGGA
ncbi:MAG: TIGR00296 family protein, partial [Thermoplasmata archaeon]